METGKQSAEVGSAFNLIGKSWELVKQNLAVFIVANLLGIVSAFSSLIPAEETTLNESEFNQTIGSGVEALTGLDTGVLVGLGVAFGLIILAAIAFFAFFSVLQIIAQTSAAQNNKLSVSQLLSEGVKRFFGVVAVSFLSGLIIIAGFLLLVVPGIIAYKRLLYAPFAYLHKNLGITEALSESNRLSKKYSSLTWAVFGVSILVGLGLAVIGALPYIGNLIATALGIAFCLIIPLRYFQLTKLESGESDQAPVTTTEATVNPAAPPPPIMK